MEVVQRDPNTLASDVPLRAGTGRHLSAPGTLTGDPSAAKLKVESHKVGDRTNSGLRLYDAARPSGFRESRGAGRSVEIQ